MTPETWQHQTLPKAELHCHLDGVLSRTLLDKIRQQDPSYPVHPVEMEQFYPVNGYERFIDWWNVLAPIKGKMAYFFPILFHHVEALKAQNVRYTEIMVGYGFLPDDTSLAIEQLLLLRQQTHQQEQGAIQVEFLLAHGRNRTAEEFHARLERTLALWEAGLIVGVGVAGIEQGYPIQPLTRTMRALHEAGVKLQVHAGEWCGPESVWDALKFGYPDRIGHGVHLFEDARLVALFQENQIPLEFSPTSNLRTGSIDHLDAHPLRRALDLGMNFSLNTDDPGVFEVTLTEEYELAARQFGFTQEDLRWVYENTVKARFQPELRVTI
jgi:adenosine deaminase